MKKVQKINGQVANNYGKIANIDYDHKFNMDDQGGYDWGFVGSYLSGGTLHLDTNTGFTNTTA